MADFECTCSITKGERALAWGDDCYCYYPKPNYTERIVRCRDCKFGVPEPNGKSVVCFGRLVETWDYENGCEKENHVEPDGFCSWGEPREQA